MAFNVFAFVGHGIIDDKDRALFLVNTKGKDKLITVQAINVDELAHEFAEIPNTFNLFLFIACRNKLKLPAKVKSDAESSIPESKEQTIEELNRQMSIKKTVKEETKRAVINNGISLILYSSMCGHTT
jgi:hypothetical protein